MKVLKPLISLLVLSSSTLFADDVKSLEGYISQNKKEQFKYDYQKNEADSSKLRDSWISPINLNYTYTKSNPYENKQIQYSASASIDQPIFQSGGIYFGIKYAEASKLYGDFSIDIAKRKLQKDAISILMQIKQMDLKITKQNLLIKNSEISLEQKEEQYLSGQLDSGFLDQAVIERNVVIQSLYDIQTNKERLISSFNSISDTDYASLHVESLNIMSKEEFLSNNLVLSLSESEIEKNRYNKNVTIAKYLPSLNAVAGYNFKESQNQQFTPTSPAISNKTDYYNYGFRVSMPLDINSFNDVESARVDYLKSKLIQDDKKRELKAKYEQVMQNLDNFDKKKLLSVQNRDIYARLLSETEELFKAGYKTKYDVELLQNSFDIQSGDIKIFEIDKQLELLNLYEVYKNAGS